RSESLAQQEIERSGGGEVAEHGRRAGGDELLVGARARGDGDALDADRLGSDDVLGRVSDHDHAALLEGSVEEAGSPLGSDGEELRPVDVIAAEAAEGEEPKEPDAVELDAGAAP